MSASSITPAWAFTDLVSLLLNWFQNDTPEGQMSTHVERLRTASYTFRMISQGLEIAAAAQPRFPELWEERFEQDLEQLRSELGMPAVQDGPWSWASNPELRQALGW